MKRLTDDSIPSGPEVNLIGQPCGHHGSYTFYKAFDYRLSPKHPKRVLMLGEFFFVRITPHDDPCIGELQLLWEDHQRNQLLSSTRLYFLPEQTPDGRLSHHGQHEVLAASDKVILKLTDLVSWITHKVDWIAGLHYHWKCPTDANQADSNGLSPRAFIHNQNVVPVNGGGSFLTSQRFINDRLKIRLKSDCTPRSFTYSRVDFSDIISQKLKSNEFHDDLSTVVVLSYSRYCRYRNLLKRIENKENEFLGNPIVQDALTELGIPLQRNNRVNILFCRDTFNHIALLNNDLNCDHLAPKLKGRPRKRPLKHKSVVRASSPESISSEDNGKVVIPRRTRRTTAVSSLATSETSYPAKKKNHKKPKEVLKKVDNQLRVVSKKSNKSELGSGSETDMSSSSSVDSNNNNTDTDNSKVNEQLKQNCVKSEAIFMIELNKFMKKRKTPIHRVPHLGFKKIDLHVFFVNAHKFGGYEQITKRRLWKKLYDIMGGDKRSTSAATCTRRHYEKLLLPFERYLNGKVGRAKSDTNSTGKEQEEMDDDIEDGNSIESEEDDTSKSPSDKQKSKHSPNAKNNSDISNGIDNSGGKDDEQIILKLTENSTNNLMKYKLSESVDCDMSISLIKDENVESKSANTSKEDVHVRAVDGDRRKEDNRFTDIVKNKCPMLDDSEVKINITNSTDKCGSNGPVDGEIKSEREPEDHSSITITPTSQPNSNPFSALSLVSRSDRQNVPTILFSHSNPHKVTALVHPTQRCEPQSVDVYDFKDSTNDEVDLQKNQSQEVLLLKSLKSETVDKKLTSSSPLHSITTLIENMPDASSLDKATTVGETNVQTKPNLAVNKSSSFSPKDKLSKANDLDARSLERLAKSNIDVQITKVPEPLPAHISSSKFVSPNKPNVNHVVSPKRNLDLEVLDLSMKKRCLEADSRTSPSQTVRRVEPPASVVSNNGVLLDLSVKKKKAHSDSNHPFPMYMHPKNAALLRKHFPIPQQPKVLSNRLEPSVKPSSVSHFSNHVRKGFTEKCKTPIVASTSEKIPSKIPSHHRQSTSTSSSHRSAMPHRPSITDYNPPLPPFIGSSFWPAWNSSSAMPHFNTVQPHSTPTSTNTTSNIPIPPQLSHINQLLSLQQQSTSRNPLPPDGNLLDRSKLNEGYASPFIMNQLFNNPHVRNSVFANLFTQSK